MGYNATPCTLRSEKVLDAATCKHKTAPQIKVVVIMMGSARKCAVRNAHLEKLKMRKYALRIAHSVDDVPEDACLQRVSAQRATRTPLMMYQKTPAFSA